MSLPTRQTTNRILLINPRDSYTLGSPPLGIGYLMAYAKKVGRNEVYLHDENFMDESALDVLLQQLIDQAEPAFVGITFPSSAVRRVAHIAAYIKEHYPGIRVFAGGYHPTAEPESTLRAIPALDFVVLGQAERTFAQMGDEWRGLPGIAYLKSAESISDPGDAGVDNLDDVPHVDRTRFDSRYFEPRSDTISGVYGKTATLISSRGCPYNCGFCANRLIQPRIKYHSIDYVLSDIEAIFSQIGRPDHLFFLDVMFLANWGRTEALCKALIRSRLLKRTKWAATVSANAITLEKAKLMREAGCFYLSFGLESNSARTLSLMGKRATPADNERAVEICRRLGLLANSAFLFGIPGEDEDGLQATLDFVKRYDIYSTGVNVMKPLPGSPYYRKLVEEGRISRTLDDWFRISSIHHQSEFYNDRIPRHIYEEYIRRFQTIVSRRDSRFRRRVNRWKRLKWRLATLVTRHRSGSECA